MTSSLNQRVVVIDLDDMTDESDTECDNGFFSGVFTSTQENPSPNLSSTLGQSLDAFDIDLNKSATDLEIDLIEEVIDEDIQRKDQNINSNVNRTNGNNYFKDIEYYLKSGSDGKHDKSCSKRNKSKKSKKRLINHLFEENLNLYRMVTELKKQLDLKTNENKELLDLKSRNLCLKCSFVAMNSLQELFCSIGGCCRSHPKSNSNDLNPIQGIRHSSQP